MSLQAIAAAHGVLFPAIGYGGQGTVTGTDVLSVTNGKVVYFGRMTNRARASKNLSGIGFRLGAVTKGGTTALKVDVMSVSTSAGPPGRDDGVSLVGGGVTIASGNLSANSWHSSSGLSGAFGTKPTVAYGDLLCIVFSFGTFNASDSLAFSKANDGTLANGISTFNGTTWSGAAGSGAVLLEFDDGTFGALGSMFPWSAQTALAVASTATEYGNAFKFPHPVTLAGVRWQVTEGTGTAYNIRVYRGTSTTPIVDVVVNTRATQDATSPRHREQYFPPVNFAANEQFRITIDPTSATSFTLQHWDVQSASHMEVVGGADHFYTTLTGGSWTDTLTRRLELRALLLGFEGGAPLMTPAHGGGLA